MVDEKAGEMLGGDGLVGTDAGATRSITVRCIPILDDLDQCCILAIKQEAAHDLGVIDKFCRPVRGTH